MGTPLVINDEVRAEIKAVREHAEANICTIDFIKRVHAGEERPIGDRDEFAVIVPMGYRCIFSIDEAEHRSGGENKFVRHLSVSVISREGRAVNQPGLEMLMEEFGFKQKLSDLIPMGFVWEEPLDDPNNPSKIAINVVEFYEKPAEVAG